MTETSDGGTNTTEQTAVKTNDLAAAVRLVNQAIDEYYHRLKDITEDDESALHPVMIEGITTRCYTVQALVNPQPLAEIMLGYDYPIYHVLEQDAPQAMWDEMARQVGLETVTSVDL